MELLGGQSGESHERNECGLGGLTFVINELALNGSSLSLTSLVSNVHAHVNIYSVIWRIFGGADSRIRISSTSTQGCLMIPNKAAAFGLYVPIFLTPTGLGTSQPKR